MFAISNDKFKTPVVGIDSATKGKFIIESASMLLDYDEDYEPCNTRASGSILIEGFDNPLFDAIKEHPLRAQGLVASVTFGTEKMFIRFKQISDYCIVDDGIVKEIDFSLTFEILDNLEYLERVIEYKVDNKL